MVVLVAFTSPTCGNCMVLKTKVLPHVKDKYPIYEFEIGPSTEIPAIFDFQLTFFPTLIAIQDKEFALFYSPHLKPKPTTPKRAIKFTGINCTITENSTSNTRFLSYTGFPLSAETLNHALDSL